MTVQTLSATPCTLGEGALWHPERGSFFWFDILGKRLFEHDGAAQKHWDFDRCVSAAGWLDRDALLIATQRDLIRFDLKTGQETHLVDLEADAPATRSNDGRADAQGGFWIGTMGFAAEPGAGAIYRYHRGELRVLFAGLTIPNAICFAPGGRLAYFTDTPTRIILRVALDEDGWPAAAPEPWLDLNAAGLNPDGAVVDAQGNLWNAQWGAARVACYDPGGALLRTVAFPARHVSCPAFGGADLSVLYATTAAEGAAAQDTRAGQTFCIQTTARGQSEHRVLL